MYAVSIGRASYQGKRTIGIKDPGQLHTFSSRGCCKRCEGVQKNGLSAY